MPRGPTSEKPDMILSPDGGRSIPERVECHIATYRRLPNYVLAITLDDEFLAGVQCAEHASVFL